MNKWGICRLYCIFGHFLQITRFSYFWKWKYTIKMEYNIALKRCLLVPNFTKDLNWPNHCISPLSYLCFKQKSVHTNMQLQHILNNTLFVQDNGHQHRSKKKRDHRRINSKKIERRSIIYIKKERYVKKYEEILNSFLSL